MTVTGTPCCNAPAVRDVQLLLQITSAAVVRAAQRSTAEPSARSCCQRTGGTRARRDTPAKIAYAHGAWQITASARSRASRARRRRLAVTTEAGRLQPHVAERRHIGAAAPQLVFEPSRRRHRKSHGDSRRQRPLPRDRQQHLLDAAEEPAARDVHNVHS